MPEAKFLPQKSFLREIWQTMKILGYTVYNYCMVLLMVPELSDDLEVIVISLCTVKTNANYM